MCVELESRPPVSHHTKAASSPQLCSGFFHRCAGQSLNVLLTTTFIDLLKCNISKSIARDMKTTRDNQIGVTIWDVNHTFTCFRRLEINLKTSLPVGHQRATRGQFQATSERCWTKRKKRKAVYLIGPDTLDLGEPSDTAAHLHVFVGGVHLLQALSDVGHHPPEDLAAHDDPRSPHAEVLSRLQGQFAQFIPRTHASLSQEDGLAAVETAQETLQLLTFDVDVIIGPHEPLVLIEVMVVHVLEHHKGLLLGWVRVVYIPQGNDGNWYGSVRAFAGEELHATWDGLSPRPVTTQRLR